MSNTRGVQSPTSRREKYNRREKEMTTTELEQADHDESNSGSKASTSKKGWTLLKEEVLVNKAHRGESVTSMKRRLEKERQDKEEQYRKEMLRTELEPLKLSELRRRAAAAGASTSELAIADDSMMTDDSKQPMSPKEAMIRLIVDNDPGVSKTGDISVNEEGELAEIRVRTMYGLVEEIQVSAGATSALSRVLYLTNQQAELFNAETVPKMMAAFEVEKPSLVINLMDSDCYPSNYEKDYDLRGKGGVDALNFVEWQPHNVQGPTHSFLTRKEATEASRQIEHFFKEVLLPLAAETNAIILCDGKNTDELSSTLTRVLPLFAAKAGGKLPFTVFCTAPAVNLAYMIDQPEMLDANVRAKSLAREISSKSKNWKKGIGRIETAAKRAAEDAGSDKPGSIEDRQTWCHEDLQPGLSNYIVVECVKEGSDGKTWQPDSSSLFVFQEHLLAALASQHPTLCVRTGGSNDSTPLTANVQLASRDIPVLMLDPQHREDLNVEIKKDKPGTLDINEEHESRDELIDAAIKSNKAHHEKLWKNGKINSFDHHELAFFYDVLNGDGKAKSTVSLAPTTGCESNKTLYQSIKDTELLHAAQADPLPFTEEQLTKVINHMVDMMAQAHLQALPDADFATIKKEGSPLFDRFPDKPGEKDDQVAHENYNDWCQTHLDASGRYQDGTLSSLGHWSDWPMSALPQLGPIGHTFAERLDTIWSVYYDIFKAKRIYGANMENLGAVALLIDQIVKRDKLPPKNSLEAQRQLRNGWNTIDICVYNAHQYKLMHKISTVLQLLLGTAIIVLTVYRPYFCAYGVQTEDDEDDTTQMAVFFTSAVLTLLTATTTFFSPAQRWRQLRAMAELLQSEIFQFRTRTGDYTVVQAEPRRPEEILKQRIQTSRAAVVQQAGLNGSAFNRKYKAKVYQHGQNAGVTSVSVEPCRQPAFVSHVPYCCGRLPSCRKH
jgi:hypothetical protein